MHIISVPDKVEKTFSLLRTFIEATNSKIISDIIVIKVKDDCSIGNKRLIQTMFKDEFLDKFFNLSITHGISDIDCEINNDIGYGFEVVVSKISLRIQLTKGIDNITPDMMETLYKLPMHSCTIFEDVSWTS